jgi:hypothetical protein
MDFKGLGTFRNGREEDYRYPTDDVGTAISILRFLITYLDPVVPQERIRLYQFIHPVAGTFEFSLSGELFPKFVGILVGRSDGHDARCPSATHGTNAYPRLIVETGQLQPFLEGFQGCFEFLRSEGGRGGGIGR